MLHFSWATCLLFNGEVISKLVLVLLPEEVHEEFTSSKNFRFHYRKKELLIVHLLFIKLLLAELFLLVYLWEWRDDHLWVFLNQVVAELNEIDI